MFDKLLEHDEALFLYLNQLGTETYDLLWILITNILTWIPLFLFFIFLIFKSYSKKEALIIIAFIVGALLLNLLFTETVKELVARLRPNNDPVISSAARILKNPTNYSFFSGHASSSFVITVMVISFVKKKVNYYYLFFLWPILFCYSRIYVGVHYPLDIFVGAVMGFLLAVISYKSYNSLKPKFNLEKNL
ncbi:phosphatase PAP2 family protein [Flavobacteriaceae bacterium R38]|nr:phosphatase PAP2 family protein [Flavobacteriaceae bacterium R38]